MLRKQDFAFSSFPRILSCCFTGTASQPSISLAAGLEIKWKRNSHRTGGTGSLNPCSFSPLLHLGVFKWQSLGWFGARGDAHGDTSPMAPKAFPSCHRLPVPCVTPSCFSQLPRSVFVITKYKKSICELLWRGGSLLKRRCVLHSNSCQRNWRMCDNPLLAGFWGFFGCFLQHRALAELRSNSCSWL